jgi:hypothetical protein
MLVSSSRLGEEVRVELLTFNLIMPFSLVTFQEYWHSRLQGNASEGRFLFHPHLPRPVLLLAPDSTSQQEFSHTVCPTAFTPLPLTLPV